MIDFLAKKFIDDYENVKSSEVRMKYGALCGGVGIFFNILLFALKLIAGFISGSVAIMADALNNLSDAGSSIVMMVGFKMANHEPDPDHPFGHGRIEYLTGLVVSMLIILMGAELARTSVVKIINPVQVEFNFVVAGILLASIAVKLYMYFYNTKISTRLESSAMKATAMDSLSDSVATFVVLLSMLAAMLFGINIDGICGLLVAMFILYTGITSAKDTIDPLLGSKASPEFVNAIEKYAMSYDDVIGIHDLVVHDYGPGRMMVSFHAEVPSDGDIMELHDTIDNLERALFDKLGCHTVIHMDPVLVGDEDTNRMKRLVDLIVRSVDESFRIHDFRMVKGPSHTNLIFDIVAPYDSKLKKEEIVKIVSEKIEALPGTHYAVIEIDRPFA